MQLGNYGRGLPVWNLAVSVVAIFIAAGTYEVAADLGGVVARLVMGPGLLEGVMIFDTWRVWFGSYAGTGMLAGGLVVGALVTRRTWVTGLLVLLVGVSLIGLDVTSWILDRQPAGLWVAQVTLPSVGLPLGVWLGGRPCVQHAVTSGLARRGLDWLAVLVVAWTAWLGPIGAAALSGSGPGYSAPWQFWVYGSIFASALTWILLTRREAVAPGPTMRPGLAELGLVVATVLAELATVSIFVPYYALRGGWIPRDLAAMVVVGLVLLSAGTSLAIGFLTSRVLIAVVPQVIVGLLLMFPLSGPGTLAEALEIPAAVVAAMIFGWIGTKMRQASTRLR